jgi:hypothetical protein
MVTSSLWELGRWITNSNTYYLRLNDYYNPGSILAQYQGQNIGAADNGSNYYSGKNLLRDAFTTN